MKYRKLVENAKKPNGFWGKMMIKAMNKGHSSLTSWGLEHMNIERTATVLDIGCGGGKTVDRLCSIVANGKVYGIDYSELSVKSSEKLNSKNILCNKAKILQASVSDMPFDNNTFDNITAVETYYFWPDKENDVKEVFRVLKQGGTVMLLFEKEPNLNTKSAFTATIPTLIYAILLIILNIVGAVDGPYAFLRVMNQPLYMSFVWFIVIVGGAFFLALLLQKLNSIGRKRK